MKPFLYLLLIVSLTLYSCKGKKESASNTGKQEPVASKQTNSTATNKEMLDSILSFKPVKLSINEEHSDVDGLIPLGYNNHGSFAYLVDENSGASSALHFGILPAYQDFSLESQLGMDEEKDTILLRHQELVCNALQSQGVRLKNEIQKISKDSLQKLYGIRFEIKKTYGAPDPDDPSGKKMLASVEINWRQDDSEYPSMITNERYQAYDSVHDVYISDCFIFPGEEGLFCFVVLVTESRGFEGYIRKSIEVKQIGVVKGASS
jgi:hypothetical protein